MELKSKLLVTVIVAAAICIIAVLGVVIYTSVRDDFTFEVNAADVKVSGQYGEKISLKNAEISMSQEEIAVTMRAKGKSEETLLKGNYNVSGYEDTCYVAVKNTALQYIIIKNDSGYYLINDLTIEDTRKLYSAIEERIQAQN